MDNLILIESKKLIYVPVIELTLNVKSTAIRPEQVTKDHKLFTIVRHPLSRLYHCYQSKFHPDRWKDLAQHHDVLRMNMTFYEVVNALFNVNLKDANKHLRPQIELLKPYLNKVQILKLETLNLTWPKLGLSELPDITDTMNFNVDNVIKCAVDFLYHDDFVTFGYN